VFRVKICGITDPDEACAVADAGADAIGLNFYPPSPRCVAPELAVRIAEALRRHDAQQGRTPTLVVGVFVNETAARIAKIQQAVGLTAIQLHGDEPPAAVAEAARACGPRVAILRAVRLPPESGLEVLNAQLADHSEEGRLPEALLVDTAAPGAFGGTGQTLAWLPLRRERPLAGGVRLLLAGGLRPANVAEAIRQARPDGVDTASGVERAPGRKDPTLVAAFVAAAKHAWEVSGRMEVGGPGCSD